MASVLLMLPMWILLQIAGLTSIAESNKLANRASRAMERGQYTAAARDYARMADELGVKDDAVLANLGQAYFRLKDYPNATKAYTRLTLSKDAGMRSLAHGQLGVLAMRQKNAGEAVVQLKEALRQDPNNQLARLNLMHMLQRNPKLEPPKNQPQKQQKNQQQNQQEQQQNEKQDPAEQQKQQANKDKEEQQKEGADKKEGQKEGEKREQKNDEQGNQAGKNNKKAEGETQKGKEQSQKGAQGNGPQEDSEEGKENDGKKPKEDLKGQIATREQLKQMQMTEERARQLLEAMRSSEVQYLQQRRHRKEAKKTGKPDW